jgi:hypothetical protein
MPTSTTLLYFQCYTLIHKKYVWIMKQYWLISIHKERARGGMKLTFKLAGISHCRIYYLSPTRLFTFLTLYAFNRRLWLTNRVIVRNKTQKCTYKSTTRVGLEPQTARSEGPSSTYHFQGKRRKLTAKKSKCILFMLCTVLAIYRVYQHMQITEWKLHKMSCLPTCFGHKSSYSGI